MQEKLIKFKNRIVETVKNDKPYILFSKCLFAIVAIIILYMIVKQLAPFLLIGIAFLFVYWDDIKVHILKPKEPIQDMQFLNNTYNALSEPICRILRNNADVLNIIKPNNLSEIQAIRGDGIAYIMNIPFYRFIVLKNCDSNISYSTIQELLQVKIQQALQTGIIPNIQYPFYKDLAFIQVINIDDYLLAQNFLSIDIMLLTSEQSYQCVCNINQQKLFKNKINIPNLTDEDF